LRSLFEVGSEIVVYRDDTDLLEKIRHFLGNESQRAAIAANGRERTMREHTYAHRVRDFVATVTSPIAIAAPMRAASDKARRAARRDVYVHLHMIEAILDGSRDARPHRRLWRVAPALLRRLVLG
jgi:hypothetical protein